MKDETRRIANENAPHLWTAQVVVRKAEREDIPTLHTLIAALADFEQLAPPDAAAQERFARDGWPPDGQSPRFTAWLAYVHNTESDAVPGTENVPVLEVSPSVRQDAIRPAEIRPNALVPAAYAITFETYSSFLARPTLYLEDIFVLQEFRRRSVGSALMRQLIQEAEARGCGRVEWVVLDWNTSAQEFYKGLGAQYLQEWHCYRLALR